MRIKSRTLSRFKEKLNWIFLEFTIIEWLVMVSIVVIIISIFIKL